MEELLKEVKTMRGELKAMRGEITAEFTAEMKDMKGKMEKFMNELYIEVSELRVEVREQRKSMEFMSEEYDRMKEDNKSMAKRLSVLEKKSGVVEKQMEEQGRDKNELEGTIIDMKNFQLQDNLEIVGLPQREHEDCKELALCVFKKIDTTLGKDIILQARRVGSPKDQYDKVKKTRPILVQLNNKSIRNYLYSNKKRIRSAFGQPREEEKVFLNESLCRETRDLLREANVKRKEKNYKFIWTSFGKVLVRKSENSKVIHIKSHKDLDMI